MTLTGLIILIVVGLVAGWLAGIIWRGGGFGLLGNLVVGLIGSFLGSFIFRLIGLHVSSIIGSIIAAIVGALILLAIVNLFARRR